MRVTLTAAAAALFTALHAVAAYAANSVLS